jgi:hypothetical protein
MVVRTLVLPCRESSRRPASRVQARRDESRRYSLRGRSTMTRFPKKDLLVPQGCHWFESSGAARRRIAGREGDHR